MAFNPGHCAACGSVGDVHEHHIVARLQGGLTLPTVYLCLPCHAALHNRSWDTCHVQLTKAGLAAAKARGQKLSGNPASLKNLDVGSKRGNEVKAAKAAARVVDLRPQIEDIQASGCTSLRQIASALNGRGIVAPRGGQWQAAQVKALLERMQSKA